MPVTGDYELNMVAEAYFASSWVPVRVLFESLQTVEGHSVVVSFYGGFYYQPLPVFADGFEGRWWIEYSHRW